MSERKIHWLDTIEVATPCQMSWDEMSGDERTRHCSQCQLNVYNLSDMTRDEAERLVANGEGRTCVRFFRRKDGTVLTRDCPVGLRAIRRRLVRALAATAALVVGMFSASIVTARISEPESASQAGPLTRLRQWVEPPVVEPDVTAVMGAFSFDPEVDTPEVDECDTPTLDQILSNLGSED